MCRPYRVTQPGDNTPITDALAVDPDGCMRASLRRTVGWPPALSDLYEVSSEIQTASLQ
jgi:hypothetical protein